MISAEALAGVHWLGRNDLELKRERPIVTLSDSAVRQFQIQRCLGRGGFGEVYEAVVIQAGAPDREVALKVLRDDVDPESGAIQRLKDEAELLARLSHPAILKVYDLTLLEGRITLITEYIAGADLDVCAEEDGSIPDRVMLQLLGIIADALDAAWNTRLADGRRLELVHRDIKPSNIRISKKGGVKLLDFGIARSDMVERRVKTSTGSLIGSPGYIAPERFLTDDVDPASDIFALGTVLYEGLTGERLFDVRMTTMAAMAVHASRYEKHLKKALLKVSNKDCIELLREMVAHIPEDRPTAEQVAHRCHALAQSSSGLELKAWCERRNWADLEHVDGILEGRVVTEHTLNQRWRKRTRDSRPPTSQPPTEATGSTPLKLALSALAAGVTVLVLLVVIGGVGAVTWLMPAQPGGALEVVNRAAADPVEEALDFPELKPALKPIAAPAPAPKARRAPAPAQTPAAVPALPAVPAATSGSFSLAFSEGSVAVELRRDGQTHRLPAKVGTGKWDIFARFNGRDFVPAGSVTAKEGEKLMISCNDVFLQCRAK
jgi:serine/threonine-protein kinase